MTTNLRPLNLLRQKRKRRRNRIPMLRLKPRPLDRPPIQPRRSARLQSCPRQPQRAQLIAQQVRRRFAIAPAAIFHGSHMRQAVQKRARRNHHRFAQNGPAIPQHHPRHQAIFPRADQHQFSHLSLQNPQVRLPFQHLLHMNPVLLLVALRARRPYRRTAARIQ